jgi:sugar phosphate isomerase/epimerase
MNRRGFVKNSLATVAVTTVAPRLMHAQGSGAVVHGVKLGITTGSLNATGGGLGGNPAGGPAAGARPTSPAGAGGGGGNNDLPQLIDQIQRLNIWGIELASGFFGPAVRGGAVGGQAPKGEPTPEYTASREALRQWRLSQASLDRFAEVRDAFKNGGVNVFSMSNTFADDCTDPEIDAMFKQMQVLGVKRFQSNQTRVATALRLGPFAEKYQIYPSFHTHAEVNDANEIASVASLDRLLAASPAFRVCLDIGHFTAGNNDAVAYMREHHDRITHIHVKDRKRDNGPNVKWGTGDTPIAQCLDLIRDRKWDIPAFVEREFRGEGSPFEETAGDLNYMRDILNKA